jgi:pimeloyl-ACP methyl ester carboxylesterase
MPYLSLGSERLHYLQMGVGSRVLLAFHGYGERATVFSVFEKCLGSDYTILSFDLPHHGSSSWPEGVALSEQHLCVLVQEVLRQHDVQRLSLMGYSIGGRVCMGIVKCLPDKIDRVLLMAADGLAINYYYYFFARTVLGKWLLRTALLRPAMSVALTDILRKLRLLPVTQYRLAMGTLQHEHSRQLLLRAWPAMRHLVYSPTALRRIVNAHNLQVILIMGRYDRVLPPKLASNFAKGVPTATVQVLDKGHRIFDAENAQAIAQHLL